MAPAGVGDDFFRVSVPPPPALAPFRWGRGLWRLLCVEAGWARGSRGSSWAVGQTRPQPEDPFVPGLAEFPKIRRSLAPTAAGETAPSGSLQPRGEPLLCLCTDLRRPSWSRRHPPTGSSVLLYPCSCDGLLEEDEGLKQALTKCEPCEHRCFLLSGPRSPAILGTEPGGL